MTNAVVVVCGLLSALFWIGSAVVTPVITQTYWDGPPAKLVRRMKLGSLLNAGGALFAALTVLFQVL